MRAAGLYDLVMKSLSHEFSRISVCTTETLSLIHPNSTFIYLFQRLKKFIQEILCLSLHFQGLELVIVCI